MRVRIQWRSLGISLAMLLGLAPLPCLAEPGAAKAFQSRFQRRVIGDIPQSSAGGGRQSTSVGASGTTNSTVDVHDLHGKPTIPAVPDWRDKIDGDNYWPSDVARELERIYHHDKAKEAFRRAELASEMINARITTFNRGTGIVTHYAPGVDLTKHRAAVDLLRGDSAPTSANGEVFVNWAWSLRTGACEEHSAIMANVLKKVTKQPVKVLKSSAGHSFVAVGLAPGADPDRPWTWGKDAFVADSWLDRVMTPQEAWDEQWIFNGGNAHTNDTSVAKEDRIRFWANYFRQKGPDYVNSRLKEVRSRIPAELINSDGTIGVRPGIDAPPTGWLKR